MKNNKKGFTLAELLIVVAIIAVLVAIAIPVFSSQLEKARQATDAANLRAAYAEASVKVLDPTADIGNSDIVKITSNGTFDKLYDSAKIGDKVLKNAKDSTNAALAKDSSYKVTVSDTGAVSFVKQP